jgi:hypothetical protein
MSGFAQSIMMSEASKVWLMIPLTTNKQDFLKIRNMSKHAKGNVNNGRQNSSIGKIIDLPKIAENIGSKLHYFNI